MIFSPYTRLHISRISFYFYSLNFIFICGLAAHTFNEKMVHEKSVITNSIGILLRLMTRSMLCDFCLFSFHTSVHLYLLLLVFPFFLYTSKSMRWMSIKSSQPLQKANWMKNISKHIFDRSIFPTNSLMPECLRLFTQIDFEKKMLLYFITHYYAFVKV